MSECWEMAVAVLDETARTSLARGGRWKRAPGDDRVDAALLIPPLRGALPHDDPRTVATLEAVRSDLVQRGWTESHDTLRGALDAALEVALGVTHAGNPKGPLIVTAIVGMFVAASAGEAPVPGTLARLLGA